jgi:hypothetical protein
MNLIKITTSDSLHRDMTSGAVLNTNKIEYVNYLQKRRQSADMKSQIQKNAEEIVEIKQDLSEIKQLLMTLIKREN